jgi:hypothetical protein
MAYAPAAIEFVSLVGETQDLNSEEGGDALDDCNDNDNTGTTGQKSSSESSKIVAGKRPPKITAAERFRAKSAKVLQAVCTPRAPGRRSSEKKQSTLPEFESAFLDRLDDSSAKDRDVAVEKARIDAEGQLDKAKIEAETQLRRVELEHKLKMDEAESKIQAPNYNMALNRSYLELKGQNYTAQQMYNFCKDIIYCLNDEERVAVGQQPPSHGTGT